MKNPSLAWALAALLLGLPAQADLPDFKPSEAILNMIYVPAAKPFFIDVFEAQRPGGGGKAFNFQSAEKAEEYCKGLNKRLPTRAEWLLAASNNGANKNFSGPGDRVEKDGKRLFHFGGEKASFPTHEWEKIGVDAIGTVGMTGNRPEWVLGADNVQCGGGYETKDTSDLRLNRTCSKESEGRWMREEKTATARCVKDFSADEVATLEYDASVTGALKDQLLARPQPPFIHQDHYSELKRACQSHVPLVSVGPMRDSLFEQDLFAFGVVVRGLGVFDCAFFGVDPEPRDDSPVLAKIDAAQARLGVSIAAPLVAHWRANSPAFKQNFYPTQPAFAAAKLKELRDEEGPSGPAAGGGKPLGQSAFKLVRQLWKSKRPQEAIWVAGDQQAHSIADRLQARLLKILETDAIEEQAPFNASGGIATKYLLKLKEGITILFKPVANAGDSAGGILNEVAASRLDRALGLYLVATSIKRADRTGAPGSFQYFVKGAKTGYELGVRTAPEDMIYLDNLLGNTDRHANNFMKLTDLDRWFAIDHNRTFGAYGTGWVPRNGERLGRIPSRRVLERLRALTPEAIQKLLGDILSPATLGLVTTFRQNLLQYSDDLVSRAGERAFIR